MYMTIDCRFRADRAGYTPDTGTPVMALPKAVCKHKEGGVTEGYQV